MAIFSYAENDKFAGGLYIILSNAERTEIGYYYYEKAVLAAVAF